MDDVLPPDRARVPRTVAAVTVLGAALVLLAWAPAAGAAALGSPAPASAADLADRIAAAWPARQARGGLFRDPASGKRVRGYGAVMLGYGLLSAGLRRKDARLVAAGVRAVDTALSEPASRRGVFDTLAVAAAYDLARRRLRDVPAFRRARPGWQDYLRSIGPPVLQAGVAGCIMSPACFHNHEAVAAAGDLGLLATRLRSSIPGAKLADRAATRADASSVLRTQAPEALRAGGRSSGPGPRRGLGLISDANTYPLAYHALSAAMLGESLAALGPRAPAAGRRTLRRAVETLAAFAAPDGDVAFIGRRQEQSWVLAATASAAGMAASLFRRDHDAVARYRALEALVLDRLERVHGVGAQGVAVVPRFRAGGGAGGFAGLDFTNTVVWNGLTVFLLDRAAEAEARDRTAGARRVAKGPAATGRSIGDADRLTAGRDGWFSDASGAGFATVRHGDLWYAVNGRPLQPDLRYDVGLIAVKRRGADGTWRDLLRPRPMTVGRAPSSAGPVLVAGGREWFPYGEELRPGPGGTLTLRGGFRDASGADLRRPLVIRYAPVGRGIRASFAVRASETIRLRTFLPARSARRTRSGAVHDADATTTLRPRPDRVRFERGFASCCDRRLLAATMELRARRSRTVTVTVRDRASSGTDARAPVFGVGIGVGVGATAA